MTGGRMTPGEGSGAGSGTLVVRGLGVALPQRSPGRGLTGQGPDGHGTVLDQVDLEVAGGEVVVLLGPSGAGKSTLVAALLGLLPGGSLVRGQAWWEPSDGDRLDLLDPAPGVRERWRGRVAAWLPQAPVASLTPVLTVGHHLAEKARVHAPAAAVPQVVGAALERHEVDPAWSRRLPSQLSGGQAQRVSNALALLGDPGLVLADEPTTGLDRALATRAGEQLRILAHEQGRAVLVVTHDLQLAEQVADAVVVLDGGATGGRLQPGELAERAREASHRHVLHRWPTTTVPSTTPAGLVGHDLRLVRGRGHVVREGLHVTVPPDRTTGLMAPSGAGKTTLLRTLALLHPPAAGHVSLDGARVRGTGHQVPASLRRRIGYVPQDPRQAVDPRWTLGRTLAEPLRLGARPRLDGRPAHDGVVADLLDRVGLPPELALRRPDEVSGGQLQRVVVARALALEPDYLLLDEPTSMVDAATARAVVAAVHAHQHATGCGVLVASHDEQLLRTWCDEVLVWEG